MFQNANSKSILKRYLVLTSILIVALLSKSHLQIGAKPLQQYQVKFRRLPPKEFSAALGSSITIECEAGASPPPSIHWLKDGKRVHTSDFDDNQLDDLGQAVPVDDVNRIALSATRSRLFIDCADLTDAATYTCVAENSYSRISSHTKLNLIRPAVLMAPPVGGHENELDEDSGLSESASGAGALKPASQQQRTAAAGRAEAVAGNGNLPLSAVPQCLSDRYSGRASPQVPARIHMWTHNIVEIMKNDVILFCRSNVGSRRGQAQQQLGGQVSQSAPSIGATAEASSAAAPLDADDSVVAADRSNKKSLISWTLPDDKLVGEEHKDKYEILETGDLLIKNLRWSDMGSYICTVSNEHNSDSASAFVYPASVKVNGSKRGQQIR